MLGVTAYKPWPLCKLLPCNNGVRFLLYRQHCGFFLVLMQIWLTNGFNIIINIFLSCEYLPHLPRSSCSYKSCFSIVLSSEHRTDALVWCWNKKRKGIREWRKKNGERERLLNWKTHPHLNHKEWSYCVLFGLFKFIFEVVEVFLLSIFPPSITEMNAHLNNKIWQREDLMSKHGLSSKYIQKTRYFC